MRVRFLENKMYRKKTCRRHQIDSYLLNVDLMTTAVLSFDCRFDDDGSVIF